MKDVFDRVTIRLRIYNKLKIIDWNCCKNYAIKTFCTGIIYIPNDKTARQGMI